MSIKYKGLGKQVKTSTMRNWFNAILEQTGGMTRYVDMLNKKNTQGQYTSEANKLYCEMLDKCIRLEPKESTTEQNITIRLDVPRVKQLSNDKTINLDKNSYTIDTTPTAYSDISNIEDIDNSLDDSIDNESI